MTSIEYTFFNNVVASDGVRHAFTSLFQFGTFDRFPDLRIVLLEAGATWLPFWLERMDSVYRSPQGFVVRQSSGTCRAPTLPGSVSSRPIPTSRRWRRSWRSWVTTGSSGLRIFLIPTTSPITFPSWKTVAQLPAEHRAGFLGENVLAAYGVAS